MACIDGLYTKVIIVDKVVQNVNLKNVDERSGTITDLENLLRTFHKKGMYVVLDLNPTAVSADHPWFQVNQYTSYKENLFTKGPVNSS